MTQVQDRLRAAVQLVQSGRLPDAEQACRGVLDTDRNNADAHALMAQLLLRRGAAPEAIEHLKEAVQHAPRQVMHRVMLGQALISLGDWRAGLAALSSAVSLAPNQFEPMAALGFALARSGNRDAASETLAKCLPLLPANAEMCRQFGEAARDVGQLEAATAAFIRWGDVQPREARARIAVAEVYFLRYEMRTALDWARRAVGMEPGNARAWALVSELLERLGEDDGACAAGRRALELDPGNTSAAIAVSKALRRKGMPGDAKAVLDAVAATYVGTPPHPGFAGETGHVLDALGQHDEAWAQFLAGRENWKQIAAQRRVSLDAYPRLVESVREFVADADLSTWPSERPHGARPAPVFFLGFPRTGSTLLEQMLGCHPKVRTTDEWPLVRGVADILLAARPGGRPYPGSIAAIDEKLRASLEAAYWKKAEQRLGSNDLKHAILVDKLPLNTAYLPLIRRIFPDAKILVGIRDPRDVVLSCFTQDFELNEGMAQFLTLETTARFFTQVMGLWLLCRDKLGLQHHAVRYEAVVENREAVLREVLKFIGLEWNDAVLRHDEVNTRSIRTASYSAANRPVRAGRVGRWREHADHLAPVFPMLQGIMEKLGYQP